MQGVYKCEMYAVFVWDICTVNKKNEKTMVIPHCEPLTSVTGKEWEEGHALTGCGDPPVESAAATFDR